MSGRSNCIFVQGRICPFQSQEVPLETCRICVEAWKTDASLRLKVVEGTAQAAARNVGSTAERQENMARLGELDQMFVGDSLEPEEYVRLRKRQTDRIIEGPKPKISLDALDAGASEPRETRLALIVKSLMGSKVHTYPDGWRLPAEINGGVVDRLQKLAEERGDEETRVGVAGYKVAVVRHAKGKLLLLLLDGDEDFEAYEGEIRRLAELFRGERHWLKALRSMSG